VPCYWTFHIAVGFIIYGHNIKFNIAEVVKRVHVVQIKSKEVWITYATSFLDTGVWTNNFGDPELPYGLLFLSTNPPIAIHLLTHHCVTALHIGVPHLE
jgi:hypothetical protein